MYSQVLQSLKRGLKYNKKGDKKELTKANNDDETLELISLPF